MIKRLFLFQVILFFVCSTQAIAQNTDGDNDSVSVNTDELERMLGEGSIGNTGGGHHYTAATFQSTRVINGQSIENTGKGVLDFRISHRFGQLNEGIKNLYGLDNATTKFDFDYGITDWLMVGFGRNSFEKEYDGFIKIKLFRQTTNAGMPVSISYAGGASARTLSVINIPGYTEDVSDKLYYFHQLIAARKFNKVLSLQIAPTYVHYNLVNLKKDPNDVLAVGAGGRLKVSKRIAITAEYYYVLPGYKLGGYNNSISAGVDIETGGHVFQLFLTNSAAISERAFIGETQGDVLKGDIHLGFNISRVFTIVHPHDFQEKERKAK